MKHKIKTIKWIFGFVALSTIFLSLIKMISQVYYLSETGWDMASFSPVYIFLAAISSIMFVSLAFLERIVNGTKIKSPEQITVLILGISGIIYSAILTYFKFKAMGWF